MPYVFLATAFVINAAASILLRADGAIPLSTGGGFVQAIVAHRFFFLGLGAFAVNVVFYALALRSLPLSVAYPVMAGGSFFIVNGYAALFFREGITLWQVLGYAFILAGIFLVLFAKRALV